MCSGEGGMGGKRNIEKTTGWVLGGDKQLVWVGQYNMKCIGMGGIKQGIELDICDWNVLS